MEKNKSTENLIKEVTRYELISDYFKKNPTRLTDRNKEYLEDILYRLYDIEAEQLPQNVKRICTRILTSLSTKLDIV